MGLHILLDDKKMPIKTWHIGQKNPVLPVEFAKVQEITADGDELAHILNRFANIPCFKMDHAYISNERPNEMDYSVHTNEFIIRPYGISAARGYTFMWYGDMARTIVANLL